MTHRSRSSVAALRWIAIAWVAAVLGSCTLDDSSPSLECQPGTDDEACKRSEEELRACACPAVYDPVCGRDDKTYGNACEARCAKVRVAHKGECAPAPDEGCVCADVYSPVCGADGKTYGNACEARCARVTVSHDGECKPRTDAGVCICPAIYDPVCGQDGKTYGNACEARCAGVPVAGDGECRASDGGVVSCSSNKDCTNGNICYPPTGQCQPACTINCLVYDPVCGADGVTYGCGAEDAHCHGVKVAYEGECTSTCACTKEYRPVCGADGKTYGNACMARCAGVAIANEGECSACASDADCPHGYCDRGVTCAGLNCPPPPPNKCTTCGDGAPLLCLALPQPCPDGQVREIVRGCYGECVDRFSCKAASSAVCEYEGKTYRAGDKFPDSDGCNSCVCGEDGAVACTLKICACDYTSPGRKWVARSPEKCATVRFTCAEGQPFFNDCGCGCELSPPSTCKVGGCSGQLCVGPKDPDVSTCEWRPEYECYRSATCEAQADGRCGWTPTEELRRCIEGAL